MRLNNQNKISSNTGKNTILLSYLEKKTQKQKGKH